MSIRLRLTLLYSAILALTLAVFGAALYLIQAQSTLTELKRDIMASGDNIRRPMTWLYLHEPPPAQPEPGRAPPMVFEEFSGDPAFQGLREREIVRVLNRNGELIASPFGVDQDALPVSAEGLQALRAKEVRWEIASSENGRLLIYNRPVVVEDQVVFILQVARSLAERDRSLAALARTLAIAGVVTTLAAFGIGWVLSGVTLRPIHRITQTAQAIGGESDFSRRVDYTGPNDEIGQLATTFNSMLARLQDAYQRVSQALQLQRQFVADVSHELRTPLTTVHGNLALLRRHPPLPPEEQADILSDLEEESDRLIRLVNDLLVLARADAGQGLAREAVPIRSVVEETCRQIGQLDPARQIVEDVQDLTVLGDRDALKQVLLILLDNALKHSQGAIRVTARGTGEQVEICVRDQGPGIPPATLAHVFERFYRGDAPPGAPGFGLGLPIARALVEGQGGSIDLESQVGQGSTAHVRFPRVS